MSDHYFDSRYGKVCIDRFGRVWPVDGSSGPYYDSIDEYERAMDRAYAAAGLGPVSGLPDIGMPVEDVDRFTPEEQAAYNAYAPVEQRLRDIGVPVENVQNIPRPDVAWRRARRDKVPYTDAGIRSLGAVGGVIPRPGIDEESARALDRAYVAAGLGSVFPDACECGAHKATGAKRGDVGHSSWCPWVSP